MRRTSSHLHTSEMPRSAGARHATGRARPPGSLDRLLWGSALALATMAAVCVLALTRQAQAEKVDTPPDAMRRAATDIVVGEVLAIYERVAQEGSWQMTRRVAEIKPRTIEKTPEAGGLNKDRLVYVRYWTRRWNATTPMPPSTNGHRGIPSVGDVVRVHAVRAGYNGFGTTSDGGLDVYGANGFESIADPETRRPR